MSPLASQITCVSSVYSTVCSGEYQRKHQSSASPAFVRGIHRSPVNSPHIGPVTQQMSWRHNDVIMQSSFAKLHPLFSAHGQLWPIFSNGVTSPRSPKRNVTLKECSLNATEVVILTSCGATGDANFVNMAVAFQWYVKWRHELPVWQQLPGLVPNLLFLVQNESHQGTQCQHPKYTAQRHG